MTTRFAIFGSVILAAFVLSGCDDYYCRGDSGGSRLGFEVVDSISQSGPRTSVTLTLTSRTATEVHTAAADTAANVVALYGGDRLGIYAARIEAAGYSVWTAEGIQLHEQHGCVGIKTQIIPVMLQRLP